MSEEETWCVRVTFELEHGVSWLRAAQIAQTIRRFGEARPGVSHAYECDTYTLDHMAERDD